MKEVIETCPTPKISIRHVVRQYFSQNQSVVALDDVTFDIHDGEFVCLVGPSGCGKSTLLNLIAGLDFPSRGEVLCDNEPIIGPSSDRTLVLQEASLFPWLNVIDNVLFGLKLKKKWLHKECVEIAMGYLSLVGLQKFRHAFIHELSGGMKSRLALVRGLAVNPKVLLMDEPFSALDALTKEQLYEDIQLLWKKEKKTIVFITHNVPEAVCLGDRVILFRRSPGKNSAEFPIDLPRNRDVRSMEVAEYSQEIIGSLRHIMSSLPQEEIV